MEELRQSFGGKCQECGSIFTLEFAHIKATGLKGKGRGLPNRYHDIKNNPSCYKLLCYDCHRNLDEEVPF